MEWSSCVSCGTTGVTTTVGNTDKGCVCVCVWARHECRVGKAGLWKQRVKKVIKINRWALRFPAAHIHLYWDYKSQQSQMSVLLVSLVRRTQTLTWSSWFQSLGWPPLAPLKLLWDRLEHDENIFYNEHRTFEQTLISHLHARTHTQYKHNTHRGANRLLSITDECCLTVSIICNGAPGVEGYVARDEP